ncbi:AraC family transcriptional regulator [Olivibacter ginsenosidimutans]|uniref:AraC family transcriptional regulator n=1 Tax=Olivibacter ginsenosidimutans TaxID=1176537 RepID=A0ABP9CGD1_9SPHI
MGMCISNHIGESIEMGNGLDMPTLPLVVERREKYSFPFGDAEVVQLALPETFIVYGDLLFKERQLNFRSSDRSDMVELNFCLLGRGQVYNQLTQQTHIVRPMVHNILYTSALDGGGKFDTESPYRFIEIHFTRKYFLHLVQDCGGLLAKFADKIAQNKYTELFEQNMPIDLEMEQCLHDIMYCPYSGSLKLLFLQSKCVELLVRQAESIKKYVQKSSLKSAYDRECICQARDYLVEHTAKPPTIPELAKIAGINEFKLKKGFKELFNNSIHGFLRDYRLNRAKEKLLQSDLPIKTIVEESGYATVQHFSTAFKKKFGMSPGKLKN